MDIQNEYNPDLTEKAKNEEQVPDVVSSGNLETTKSNLASLSIPQKGSMLICMNASTIQALAAFIGISIGTALSLTIFAIVPSETILGKLFNLQHIQGALPLIMLGMFFWGILLCLIRQIRNRSVQKYTSDSIVSELSAKMNSIPLKEMLAEIEGLRLSQAVPLLRRLRVILRQWCTKPSLQDSISLLDQQAASDIEELRHAYGVVRTFIWALPVLGLIGTVIGIALAVGDFGHLIGGNVDDVGVIKTSLVHVTSGLSFAFTTTLLGLLGALLLVLPSSSSQAREEKLLTRTDSILSEHFLPNIQHKYPEKVQDSLIFDSEQLSETLADIGKAAVHAAGTAANKLLEDTYVRFSEWQQRIESKSQQAALKITNAAKELGMALSSTSDEFLKRLSMIRESMDKHTIVLRNSIKRSLDSSQEITQKLDSVMEKHNRATTEVSSLLLQIHESSTVLLKSHAVLSRSLEEIANGDRAKILESLAQTMESIGGQNTATCSALENMAGATQRLTACQEAIQSNMKRMEDMGLASALDNLGGTLTDVSTVLQQFQEPIVFQAVRASTLPARKSKPATQGGTLTD